MAELSMRYATALFELASENGKLDEYLDHSIFLRDTLQGEECRFIIEHPQISTKEKHAFLKESFGGKIYDDLLGFLQLAIAKNREKFLVPALSAFITMVESHNRKTQAEVVSAIDLTDDQISKIKAVLSKKLNKQVEIISKTDPDVIGGLRIRVDGYFIDRTIRTQLNDMVDTIKRSAPNDSETR